MTSGSKPGVVGVTPAPAHAARRRLFDALEQVLPVRFEARSPDSLGSLDAVLCFGPLDAHEPLPSDAPVVVFSDCVDAVAGAEGCVDLGHSPSVARPFRGRSVRDRTGPSVPPIDAEPGDEILATYEGRPLWLRRRDVDLAALAPPELEPTETLRDLFRPGRCLSLLPLVHALRRLTEARARALPPLRAAIVIDDPNLHWTSYGHVRFAALAEHARAHGYHVAFATIPLDLWYFDRRAARIFRENADVLSLAVHGNSHSKRELARARSGTQATRTVGHALARVRRFERRSGLPVSRVMIPPHGDFDSPTLDALAVQGFDAACWSPKPRSVISGFDVADVADGGLPSIPRSLLGRWADLPFRAFLGQPIVLEGHHTDFASGLDLLEEAASEVAHLGEPTWMPLGEIARSNLVVRPAGDILDVRMYSRRAALTIPDGIRTLSVDAPAYGSSEDDGITVTVDAGMAELRIARRATRQAVARTPAPRPWPMLRRVLSESRDRALPAVATLEGARKLRLGP